MTEAIFLAANGLSLLERIVGTQRWNNLDFRPRIANPNKSKRPQIRYVLEGLIPLSLFGLIRTDQREHPDERHWQLYTMAGALEATKLATYATTIGVLYGIIFG